MAVALSSFTAKQIETHIRRYIVGQDDAVKTISVAVAQHSARSMYSGDVRLKKANVLIVGPSGCGKTRLVQVLAEVLDVPFAQVSAPSITQPGFTGLDPDEPLKALLRVAPKEEAERGICFIDEVDKIARRSSDEEEKSRNLTTNLGVQQAMLGVLESERWMMEDGSVMRTDGILFVLAGAFVGIERLVAGRMRSRAAAPRPLDRSEALRSLEPMDLIAYGLIPEFVGRCPVIVKMRPLDASDILRVLTEPADAPAKRIKAEFEGAGATLDLSEAWLYSVAAEAAQHPLGARSLEGTIRERLRDAFFACQPGDHITIDPSGGWRRDA